MPKPASEANPNELLQYERNKRHWTHEDVMKHISRLDASVAIDANTVGRWERGITEPTSHHLKLLTGLYGRRSEELGYVSADRIPFSNVSNISLPNPFFTGREDILKKLATVPVLRDEYRKLNPRKLPMQQPPQALTGLGGIGKTQIALAYAYRHMHDYHTIVWVRADSLQTLRIDFAGLATVLNLPEQQLSDQEQSITAVKEWFTHMTRWLLIFDSADTPEYIYSFIPSPCYGHLLLTTRSHAFVPEIGAHTIVVDEMTPEEAMTFLLQRAKIIDRTSSHTSATPANQALASTIAETLGRLPLALDQAGAYMQRTQCGLSRYLDSFQQEHDRLLRYHGNSITYVHSVASTWSLNVEHIRQANPLAIDLLSLFAFLHPDAIPEALLLEGPSHTGTPQQAIASDSIALDLATEELLRYSLVRRNPDVGTYTIHPLVQTVIQDQMPKDRQRQWAEQAVQTVNRLFPEVKFTTWSTCERYLPHAQTCAAHIAQWDLTSVEAARLLDQLGVYLLQHERYLDAEPLIQQGLKMREHIFGPCHLDVASSLIHLGLLSYYQYQDTQAEVCYQRALAITEQLHGPRYPALTDILHALGDLFYNQDNYPQAEAYYVKARTLLEQSPESNSADIARNLSNLGLTWYKQRRYTEAEPLLKQALEMNIHTLGADHPDVATQLCNLARLYHAQGNDGEAETLFQQALTIREQALGASALAVANSLNYLARFYEEQRDHATAEPLLRRAVAIVRQKLPKTHPLRSDIESRYRDLLQTMGKSARAGKPLSQEK